MAKVTVDISMSLDGFIAGPSDGPGQPLGDGGERLHQWIYDLASWRERHSVDPRTGKPFATDDEINSDDAVIAEAFANVGAVVMGRRMFDGGEGPWGDNPPFHMPVFVVTHEAREPVVKEGGTVFIFVTNGVQNAMTQAKAVAGEKYVSVAGGADIIQQCLRTGLLDEIQIHLVPVLLGGGRRLFDDLGTEHIELERTRVLASPGVTHLRFRVLE